MIKKERAMDLGSHTTRIKGRREKLVGALSRMLLRLDATSVGLWVILLMIVRREIVSTSVGRKVTSHLSERRKLLVSIVVKRVILVLSVPNRRRRRVRCFALNAEEVEQPDSLI